MTDLNGKSVLITGAGGGFGLHMTRQFRDAGCRLLLTDLTADALAKAKEAAGGAVAFEFTGDLATDTGCDALADSVLGQGPVPDVLVNNAGIGMSGRHDHVPRDRREALMRLNLHAPMQLCERFVPGMLARGSGHIVNISSLAGWIGTQGLAAYCASKYGLRGFGEALAEDLAPHGVRVTNVYPCFSRTPILDSEQFGYARRRAVPEHLISEPADVVREILRGVRRDRLHVFPDRQARRVHLLKRFVPWVIPLLNRRMTNDAIRAAGESA